MNGADPAEHEESQSLSEILHRTASLSVLVHGAGIGLAFVAQIVLARVLGAREFGSFAWAMAAVNLAVVLARAGLDTTTLRFGATSVARGDRDAFALLLQFAHHRVLRRSLLLAPLLVGAMILSPRTDTAGIIQVAGICALWFPLFAANGVRQAALLAQGWIARSYAPETIVRPIVLVCCICVIERITQPGARAAVASAGLAVAAAYVVGRYWIGDLAAAADGRVPTAEQKSEWTTASRGLFRLTVVYAALSQLDTLALGFVASSADVGVYSVAKQIASVCLFGMIAIQTGMAPSLAATHAEQDHVKLASVVNFVAWTGVGFAAASAALIILVKGWLLRMFGPEFSNGVHALYLLIAAQGVIALGGPAGIMASMTGSQNAATKAYAVAAIIVTACTVAFYRGLGIVAPALGAFVASIAWTMMLRRHLIRVSGIDTMPRMHVLWR